MSYLKHLNLRARLALLVAGVVTAVVGIVSCIFVYSLSTNLDASMVSKSAVMQEALRRKGMTLANNVALSSSRSVAIGNFTFLLEVIRASRANDGEVLYGIIMDNDRHALVQSDPGPLGVVLQDDAALFAAQQHVPTSHMVNYHGNPVLEVVAPIVVEDVPWGTVRLGLSLDEVAHEIATSEAVARQQILRAILTGLGAAVLLLLLGCVFGVRAAASLIEPLQSVLDGADRLREGDMSREVVVDGGIEFQSLANAFNNMSDAIKSREDAMQRALEDSREANRLKSEFLANVSHELRTPLNAIINIPAALSKDYDTRLLWCCPHCHSEFEPDTNSQGEDVRERCPNCASAMSLQMRAFYYGDPTQHFHFLQRTLQSAQHLLAVVTDILDFSKLEAGKMTLHTTNLAVRTLFDEVNDTVSALADAKKIKLVWPHVAAQCHVYGDPVKIAQVLLNLVGNSVKFTPHGGEIAVLYSERGTNFGQFSVQDTGIGIPKDKLSQLFQSFRQLDGSHTRAHGGTGLGLAISRKIVELHGGKIWAESTLGQGSRFSFTIPLSGGPESEHNARDGQRYAGRVLVVDDDRVQLDLAQRFLGEVGYDVSCLADPTQVESTVSRAHFDVVILDIMMPGVSGLSVLKNMKRNSKMPVIVSTAYHMNKDLVVSLGGIWLPKPWTNEQLVACVSETASSRAT